MSISRDDILKIAKLSRIRLKDEEVDHFQQELSNILGWVEQLQEVDTEGVAQMTSVNHATLSSREDVVNDGNIQEQVLANAPESKMGYFVVPKVMEG